MHETIVWISGATEGIGLGLARNVPYPEARIINLSRRQHPDYESVRFDLVDPSTWDVICDHFAAELRNFKGKRAIFIQNAYLGASHGFVGEGDPRVYRKAVTANVAAPLVLAEAFVRACRGGDYESGLVMMTSAAARVAWEGDAVYCAAKAAAEQWVRAVRMERKRRGTGPWVIAIRPGFVDTPAVRAAINTDFEQWPLGPFVKRELEAGKALDIDTCARNIWGALPPGPERSVLWFGEMVKQE